MFRLKEVEVCTLRSRLLEIHQTREFAALGWENPLHPPKPADFTMQVQPHCWRMPEAAREQELLLIFLTLKIIILCIWITDEPKLQWLIQVLVQACIFIENK